MENFIQIGKDKIKISEETARNLREQFGKKEKEDLIDVQVDRIRISESGRKDFPVRISILEAAKHGREKGDFYDYPQDSDSVGLPGDVIYIKSAIELRDTLDRIIKKRDC